MADSQQGSTLESLKKHSKTIIAAVLAISVLIVIFQNTETVETHLLWITISMPRAVLLAITFALGALSGILFSMRRRR